MGNSSVCWFYRWVTYPSYASVYESRLLQSEGFYSVIVQAVVDHNLLFTDLNIGWPGSVHDVRVLQIQLYIISITAKSSCKEMVFVSIILPFQYS